MSTSRSNWRQLSTARRMDIICQAQIEGRSTRDLAIQLGVSHECIARFARTYGMPFSQAREVARRATREGLIDQSGGKALPWSLLTHAERLDAVRPLLRQGVSTRTIAKLVYADSVHQIYSFIKQNRDELDKPHRSAIPSTRPSERASA